MKTSRLLLPTFLFLALAFTGCNNEDWLHEARQDPDPLKENLTFNSAGGVFTGENAEGTVNSYILIFSNLTGTRTDEVAIGETLSLELTGPVSDNLKILPEGTYNFDSTDGNSIVKGRNSYMTSVYSEVAEAYRYITGGSVTLSYKDDRYTVSGKLSSKNYEFQVDYTGAINIPSEYSRIITFEKAALMSNTGNQNVYNNILWGIDQAEEDDDFGWLIYEGMLYEEKGAGFGGYWNDYWGDWDTWGGLVVSYNYDKKTPGLANQFSAYATDSGKFGIAYDLGTMMGSTYARPFIEFTPAAEPISANIANSTNAYLYCVDKIASGLVDDFYFTLTITGYLNSEITASVKVPLAENGVTLADWKEIDLTPLGLVDNVKFAFDSNDAHPIYGSNVPSYCCIDDIKIK